MTVTANEGGDKTAAPATPHAPCATATVPPTAAGADHVARTAPDPTIGARGGQTHRRPHPGDAAPVGSETRGSLEAFLRRWANDPRLVHVHEAPARPARTGALTRPLPREVWHRLGVRELWSHQAEAIELLRAGTSTVVATGTASGKSLCYQAPIAEAIVSPRPASALMLFPTKALAHDQRRALEALGIPGLVAAPYDGDSGPAERSAARRHANVVLTNPEMLHHGILPHHDRWATFLLRLRYVVVDELHVLRGVFGSHVAHLLRRLRRLCAHYGNAGPTFCFSSATIGDPARLASELAGLPVTAVTHDGAPRAPRLFALWNPSGADSTGVAEADTGRHTSAPRDTARLTAELVRNGHRTIAFARSRKGAELMAAEVNRRLPMHQQGAVRPYRSGYLPHERRTIEAELAAGEALGVVATTALELGVDIGGLDACVLCGFPGAVASLWQQVGRTGRADRPSLALLVGGDDQLDQWFLSHPHELFARPPEPAVVNPANPFVLLPQLACAAHELPLSHTDETYWPGLLDDAVRRLVHDDQVAVRAQHRKVRGPAAVWAGAGWPAHRVSLRSSSAAEVRIITADGALVGLIDAARATSTVHPGAVYLHLGQSWKVTRLDLAARTAVVAPADGGEYTQPRRSSDLTVVATEQSRPLGAATISLGSVRVVTTIDGFRRVDSFSGEVLAIDDLELPPAELTTRAVWWTLPPATADAAGVSRNRLPGALHAVEHAALGLLPLFTVCDRWDVGGLSSPKLADTGGPTIVIYDAYAGGAGIAELGYERAERHLQATLELVASCSCHDGCPSCVQSPMCGRGNEPLDKAGAIALLRAVLGARPVDA